MSANDTTYQIILDSNGIKAWTMPDEGFYPDVEIHCWGAGGGSGWGGAPGGGGGYARTTANINPGDEVTLQIGQPGRNAPAATGAGGAGGLDTTYQNFRGGNGGARGTWCGQNGGPYPSGGGGGASFVAVDGSFVCVAAGGGGGGGYGHNNYKDAGKPGGVYPGSASSIYAVTLSYAWNSFMNTYAVWGAGQDYTVTLNFPVTGTYTFNYAVDNYGSVYLDGNEIISYAGFSSTTTYTQTVSAGNHTVRVTGVNTGGPAGVAAQILKPDTTELWNTRALRFTSGLTSNFGGSNASYGGGGGAGYLGGASGFASGHTVTGGNGGLNYGGVTAAGSGTLPGGLTSAYYPGKKLGEAGYPGYIVIILRKKFNVFIKNPDTSGDWVRANIAYVKIPSQSVTVSQAVGAQTTTYNSVGTSTFTVPAGVTSIQLTVIGGGGGGGGNDSSPGASGRAGARASGALAVSPGQILTISVGSGGGGGSSDQGSAPGGVGGTNGLGYSGGRGSNSGPTPISGGGGGGGAASAVLVNGSPTVVAAGGGGGGGGGNGVPGQGVSPGGTSGGIAGGSGTPKGGDGGGAGGGGGGYPQGGAGGSVNGGDVGGNSGADGQSLVPAGFSLGEGGAGGINAIRGGRASSGGGGGSVTISYTPAPVNVTVVTGGWKQIQQAFTKVDNEWEPILTNKPIELYNYPTKRRAVNINIVVPTYNFVVYDNLPVQYFEGLLDVNVYIAANTTVGSTNVTTPAFLVNQFSPRDTVKISNYGNIAGRGGDGGAAGSYSTSTSYSYYSYNSKGQPVYNSKGGYRTATTVVTSVPGRPGQFGGAGLRLDFPTVIENYGTIAGGGGGGGGGGGPTGGQGGGGAGAVPGNGGNNGTFTAGGAGLGFGGAGAAQGTRGTDGTNDNNSGGLGGASGAAVVNISNAIFTVAGTTIGPIT